MKSMDEIKGEDYILYMMGLAGILLILWFLWTYIIKPILSSMIRHYIITLLVTLTLVCLSFMYFKKKKNEENNLKREKQEARQKLEKEEAEFEKKQNSLGLFKYINKLGEITWANQETIEKLKADEIKRAEEALLINRIITSIREFKESRKYKNEYEYQLELQGWLKSKFIDSEIEMQIGSSRPDIVINKTIAIEVKGPTRSQDLATVVDKCLRYLTHFKELIIVLFDVDVSEKRYNEWRDAIDRHHPNVKIIKKSISTTTRVKRRRLRVLNQT